MKFNTKGIRARSPELAEFRTTWAQFTYEENTAMNGHQPTAVSDMQRFVIDMYTGNDAPYANLEDTSDGEVVLEGAFLAQMELESLFRARSRALAVAFQKGQIAV